MSTAKKRISMVLGVALLSGALAPFLPNYYAGLLSEVLIFAVFAMSLDLLVGFMGLPSLGHAAYFGMGSYTAGLIALNYTHNIWVCAAAGTLAALVTALLFGLLVLRTGGASFLMITLALSQILWGIAFKWRSFTGGEDGLSGIARTSMGIPWDLTPVHGFLWLAIIFFAVMGALIALYHISPFGLALQGIRESETRMRSLGYNVWLYKYIGHAVAAMVAGVSGVMFLFYNSFVSPNYLSTGFSAKALLMVILGGSGTLLGPVFGSLVIVALENVVSFFTERWMMIIGATYVLVVLFFPKGVLGSLGKLTGRRQG